jgi:hypothetical protein
MTERLNDPSGAFTHIISKCRGVHFDKFTVSCVNPPCLRSAAKSLTEIPFWDIKITYEFITEYTVFKKTPVFK